MSLISTLENCLWNFWINIASWRIESLQMQNQELTVATFDFLYLSMDFGTGCNKGYAFVNFMDPRAVWKYYKALDKKAWDFYQSPKVREIVCAKIQGKKALVQHFEKSSFFCELDEFLPICFSPLRYVLFSPYGASTQTTSDLILPGGRYVGILNICWDRSHRCPYFLMFSKKISSAKMGRLSKSLS